MAVVNDCFPDDIFLQPDAEVKIWHYMDIVKFLSMLDQHALFFSRVDLHDDSYEGSIPNENLNLNNIVPKSARPFPLLLLPDSISPHDFIRKQAYSFSFHMNTDESAALWSIYTKSKQGVAIQSTFSRLCDCFNVYHEGNIKIGMINYIDYRYQKFDYSIFDNPYLPLIYKRTSFEYEKELRALIINPKCVSHMPTSQEDLNQNPKGLSVSVDLDILIENIFIAPKSPTWIKEVITSVLHKYGIYKEPLQSSLDESPII